MPNPRLKAGYHPGALTRSNDGGAWDTQLDPEEVMDVLVKAGWAEEGPETLDHGIKPSHWRDSGLGRSRIARLISDNSEL